MNNLVDKIIKSAISEIIESILFGICLFVAFMLPEDSIRQSIINLIIILWVVVGIGSPVVIFAELERKVSYLFKGFRNR
jgi:hypothetical protein